MPLKFESLAEKNFNKLNDLKVGKFNKNDN